MTLRYPKGKTDVASEHVMGHNLPLAVDIAYMCSFPRILKCLHGNLRESLSTDNMEGKFFIFRRWEFPFLSSPQLFCSQLIQYIIYLFNSVVILLLGTFPL